MITLAIPKGRLLRQLAPRLAAVGFAEESLGEQDRRLIRSNVAGTARLFLL